MIRPYKTSAASNSDSELPIRNPKSATRNSKPPPPRYSIMPQCKAAQQERPRNVRFPQPAGNIRKPVPGPRLHDRNRLARVHVRLPTHGPARLRHCHNQLHAESQMRRAKKPEVLPPKL